MHTILVADDSVTILKAVEIVFDKEPFQVLKAGSGAEAIAKARDLRPSLVLADHHMGDKSGYEVAEALRADPSTSGIPVMILSGGATAPYDEGRAKAAGVVGHVPKPFDCQTLLDRVRNVLGVAATAPGTAVGVPASSAAPSAAVAAMPRPPGIPGGGIPRAPTGIGMRPVAPAIAATPSIPSAMPMNRTPTPQPARADLDPFGFGASLASGAATPAPISTTPRPAVAPVTPAFSNPFATGAAIGASASPAPMTSSPPMSSPPMTSPPSITAQQSNGPEPWKTTRGADVSFEISMDDGVKPAPVTPKPATSSFVGDTEFLEVADIEVTDIPSTPSLPPTPATTPPPARPLVSPPDLRQADMSAATQKISVIHDEPSRRTDKVDLDQLARLDAELSARSEPVKLELATAADVVAEKAATVIAKTTGSAPSKELLTEEARQIVERVAWEVVPELAEVIIREEIQRLLKSRG